MASIGQADHHINSISGLGSIHPAAFSTGWGSDYRDRYPTEMQGSYHHGRSLLNRSGPARSRYPHQQQVPIESSSSVGHQRHPSGTSFLPQHQHSIHTADSIDIRRGGGNLSRVPAMLGSPDSMSRGSPGSFQGSSSELFDNSGGTVGSGGDWHQFMDSGVRYLTLCPNSPSGSPLQHQQHGSASCKASGSGDGGIDEGAMIRELIGRLGGGSSNGGPSSPPLPPHRAAVGMESLAALEVGGGNHNGWNSAVASAVELTSNVGGLTVDPSKGGLSLSAVGAGLPTSHCLPPFSADPGFAERAAKFSSFIGNYAQPFSPAASESAGTGGMRPWSGGTPLSECQSFSKHGSGVTSSCLPTPRESAGVLNGSSSVPPQEGLPESMIADNHSGREISENLVGSTAAAAAAAGADEDEDDDENDDTVTAEGNYGSAKEKAAMKLLSRTSSNLLATTNHADDEEGGGRTTTTSADPSSSPRRIRGLSTSNLDREQVASAGHREACVSPGGSTVTGATDISAKKRRSNGDERHPSKDIGSLSVSSHAKATEADREDTKAKRLRRGHGDFSKEKEETRSKAAAERSSSETSGETSPRSMKEQSKPSEPPKTDYIHVRARRGQATDSHSLAERVRREKISERMKFLQDLVPGCSKVTGKAVMLDEIINYVQSLQRQVEFLSMKLASVSPRLDFNLDGFIGKEGPHPGCQMVGLGPETSISYPPLQHSQPHQGLDYQMHSETPNIRRNMNPPPIPAVTPPCIEAFGDSVGQLMWDGDLQSIVQMGLGPGHTPSAANPSSHCHVPPGQVKVELQQSPISCL